MSRVGMVLAIALMVPIVPAAAEQAVPVGGALALLNKPSAPRAAVVLIPGGDGVLGVRPDGTFASLRGNQLVRTRKAYARHGLATLTIDRPAALPNAATVGSTDQCDNSVGTVMACSIPRVAPPRMNSRSREWP